MKTYQSFNWEKETWEAEPGFVFFPPVLLLITLGNPKQECRYLGICRVEILEGQYTVARELQMKNNCVARFEYLDPGKRLLKCTVLDKYLMDCTRIRYFRESFQIESPFRLPEETARQLGVHPFVILPGKFELSRALLGLEILFPIVWAI
ncbi:MAG: hypothetical protein KDD02_03955 [Phaeodactylibacter sp.]|nr:hypothetical protein [Phaeodactylibacter sp.]MCB9302036.1 hypothetical protein [Lewinellaceae bacterium]